VCLEGLSENPVFSFGVCADRGGPARVGSRNQATTEGGGLEETAKRGGWAMACAEKAVDGRCQSRAMIRVRLIPSTFVLAACNSDRHPRSPARSLAVSIASPFTFRSLDYPSDGPRWTTQTTAKRRTVGSRNQATTEGGGLEGTAKRGGPAAAKQTPRTG
jgi:hypothetical protein